MKTKFTINIENSKIKYIQNLCIFFLKLKNKNHQNKYKKKECKNILIKKFI